MIKTRALLAVAPIVASLPATMAIAQPAAPLAMAPRESRVQAGKASLYSREVGRGQPLIILHGGPDFDHRYLLPDLDRLADAFRLIYYDQRGRGRSADQVMPEDVTLASDIDDLDKVRHTLDWNRRHCSDTPGARSLPWSMRFNTRTACRT